MKNARVLGAALFAFASVGAVSTNASAAWTAVTNFHPSALGYAPDSALGAYYALVDGNVDIFQVRGSSAIDVVNVGCGADDVAQLSCADLECYDLWIVQEVNGSPSLRSCNPVSGAWNGPAVSFSKGPNLQFGIRQIAGDGGPNQGVYVVQGAPAPNGELWHWDSKTGWTTPVTVGVSYVAVNRSGTLFFSESGSTQFPELFEYANDTITYTGAQLSGSGVWSGLAAEDVLGWNGALWEPSWTQFEPALPSGNPIASFTADGVPGSSSFGVLAVDSAGNLYQDASACFPGPCGATAAVLIEE